MRFSKSFHLLCFSIGNSQSKAGLYLGKKRILSFSLPTVSLNMDNLSSLLEPAKIDHCIFCSVVKGKEHFLQHYFSSRKTGYTHVEHKMIKNIVNTYEKPIDIGIDRLLSISYCFHLAKKSVLVFDFGTATTATIADKKGFLGGGAIMPGIQLQLNSLQSGTSLLPCAEIHEPDQLISKNTKDAIMSGVLSNTVFFTYCFADYCRKHWGLTPDDLEIFFTGGFSDLISKYISRLFGKNIKFKTDKDICIKALHYHYQTKVEVPEI